MVFPAPLGPISEVTVLRCTSRWSTSTARMPPKARRMPSTISTGSGLATPGSGGQLASSGWVSRIDQALLTVAEDALRAEDEQQDQPEPDEHVLDLARRRTP